jgi:hypothetical protein
LQPKSVFSNAPDKYTKSNSDSIMQISVKDVQDAIVRLFAKC